MYKRPSYNIKTTGVFTFKTKDKEYLLKSYNFERENDTEDSLEIQDELRGEIGSIRIKNSAWNKLAKGETIIAKTSKARGDISGRLTRIDDINNSDKYAEGGGIDGVKVGGYEVDFFHTVSNVYANIEIPSENPLFEDDIQIKGVGKTEQEALEDLKKNYKNKKYAEGGSVGYVNQYFGKGYENDAIIELKKALPNHTFEKDKNSIIIDGGKFVIDTDSGRYGFIRAYSSEGSEGGISVQKLDEAISFIEGSNKFAEGGGVGLDNFDALDLPISYKLINNKGEVIFKTNSFNKASDTRTIKGFEGEGKLKIIATDKSGNQKIIADGIDEDGKKYEKGRDMNKYAKGGSIDTPKIYVADLEAYNNGKLVGKWLDLSDFEDGKDVSKEISKLLKKWGAEEYAIHDVENVPSSIYSEYMGEEDFDKIIKIYKASEENDLPYEVISEIMLQYEPEDLEEWISEHYEGHFDNDTDLAYNVVESIGGVSDLGKKTTEMYFDYEGFGRDLEINDEWEGDFDSNEDRGYDYVENMGGVSELGDKTIDMYFDYEKFGRDLAIDDYTEIEDGYYFRTPRYAKGGLTNERRYVNKSQDYEVRYAKNRLKRTGYKNERKFAVGGEIGNTVSFKGDYGTPRSGVVKEKRGSSYIVATDDGDRLVDSYEVISFSETPIAKKKRFGFFEGGGEVVTVSFNRVKSNFKNNLEIFNGEVVTIGNHKFKIEGNKFYIKRPNEDWTIFRIIKGEMFAGGGMVVTKIKDIPNFKERLDEGMITYRGLGMGKLSDDFYKLSGTNGTRIKVEGKEYFITDEEFDTFSRDESGKLRVRFNAPSRKYAGGGEVNSGYNVFNYTDNIYATDEVFKTKALANKFIKEFRNRFANQGYYRDNRMNKINIQDIDLLAIRFDFNPLKKFAGGGEIENKIEKLKKVVSSKMLPESVKAKAQAEIDKLEKELEKAKENKMTGESEGERNVGMDEEEDYIEAKTKALEKSLKDKTISETQRKRDEKELALFKGAKEPKFKIGDVVGLDLDERTPKMITSFKTNRKGEIIYSGYYIPFPNEKWNYEESELVLLKTPSKPEAKKPTTRKAPVKKAVVKKAVAKKVVKGDLPKSKFEIGDKIGVSGHNEVYEIKDKSYRNNIEGELTWVYYLPEYSSVLVSEKNLKVIPKPKADHKKLVAKLKAKKGDKGYDNRASINASTGERYKRSESSDKKREAKPLGKRISEDGSVYYENRLNRGDLSKKDKFEDGGEVKGSDWGLNLNW